MRPRQSVLALCVLSTLVAATAPAAPRSFAQRRADKRSAIADVERLRSSGAQVGRLPVLARGGPAEITFAASLTGAFGLLTTLMQATSSHATPPDGRLMSLAPGALITLGAAWVGVNAHTWDREQRRLAVLDAELERDHSGDRLGTGTLRYIADRMRDRRDLLNARIENLYVRDRRLGALRAVIPMGASKAAGVDPEAPFRAATDAEAKPLLEKMAKAQESYARASRALFDRSLGQE